MSGNRRAWRINEIWKQKANSQDPHKYRGITVGSIMIKVLINIVLTRSIKINSSRLSLDFTPVRCMIMAYMSANNSRIFFKSLVEIM